ncbi:MAG: hypothetical protein KME52_02000 [Desmonostoc geniculatum HA4340-LM1]|nr:hypothetical protein [Desmonostoc geniculatum HA4340-LM1]
MLLDGQLRWSAAKLLGWETIRALIVPQPQDLDQSSLQKLKEIGKLIG